MTTRADAPAQAHEAAERGEYGDGIGLNLEHDTPARSSAVASAKAEAKHSPLPWAHDYDRTNDRFNMRSTKTGSFGHFQGWSADGVTTYDEDKANAAFIVHACNNAQRLADALKERSGLIREMRIYLMQLRVTGVQQSNLEQLISEAEALAQWKQDKP